LVHAHMVEVLGWIIKESNSGIVTETESCPKIP